MIFPTTFAPAVPANWASSFIESSADQPRAFPLVATATRSARSVSRVTIVLLVIISSLHYVKFLPALRFLLVSRHAESFDKPFTTIASGTVNDSRT